MSTFRLNDFRPGTALPSCVCGSGKIDQCLGFSNILQAYKLLCTCGRITQATESGYIVKESGR